MKLEKQKWLCIMLRWGYVLICAYLTIEVGIFSILTVDKFVLSHAFYNLHLACFSLPHRPVIHISVTTHQLTGTVTEYDAQTHTNNHVCGHLLGCPLFLGASIHGNDDPTDDNSSADAADPLSASAPSFTPTATSPYAATGNTHTHTTTHMGTTQVTTHTT